MKKTMTILSAVALLFGVVGTAGAFTFYSDRAPWEAAVTSFVETSDVPGFDPISTITAGTGIDIGYGETLAFDIDMSLRAIGNGWVTWSGGYTGEVLYTQGATSVTGTFSPGNLFGFGFEAEPDPFGLFDITLTLQDLSTLTQTVQGDSGAKFFGWTQELGDPDILSMTVSSAEAFAIGRFVAAAPIPEPATIMLLGAGLLGLAAARRGKRLG